MKQITTIDELEQNKKEHEFLLLKLSASWCQPCKSYAPVIEAVSDEREDVYIAEVDIDDLPEAREFFNIRSVPTLVILKNGNYLDSLVGTKSGDSVNAWIDAKVTA